MMQVASVATPCRNPEAKSHRDPLFLSPSRLRVLHVTITSEYDALMRIFRSAATPQRATLPFTAISHCPDACVVGIVDKGTSCLAMKHVTAHLVSPRQAYDFRRSDADLHERRG